MSEERKSFRWALWLPLVIFAGFLVLVLNGLLRPADRDVDSAMIGQKLPEFALPPAIEGQPGLSNADFGPAVSGGKPRLLNIFASWCIPCAIESPQLDTLKARGVQIDGIAIRDRQQDVQAFLERNGNPFSRIGADDVSAVQLSLGSSGVPESFIVDGSGTITYQHIGVIGPNDLPLIMDELREAGL